VSRGRPPLVVYVDSQRPGLSMLDGPVRYAEVEELPSALAGAELLLVWASRPPERWRRQSTVMAKGCDGCT
jgi:hypothetical protein